MKKKTNNLNFRLFSFHKIEIFSILSITLLCAGLYFYQQSDRPLYQTSTTVVVDSSSQSMPTMELMIGDKSILKKVINELQLPYTTKRLSENMNVERLEDPAVFRISVIDTEPERAALIANTTVRILRNTSIETFGSQNINLLVEAKENRLPIK